MSGERYLYRVYCLFQNQYVTTISDTPPTVCPVDGQAIDSTATTILQWNFRDVSTDGYLNLESTLADTNAVRLLASDTNGGINITAGFGGIVIDTTNSISMDCAAACHYRTTVGNLELEATNAGSGGLINMDADSGINIGSDTSAHATNTSTINIGTSTNAKTITIGNTTSTTAVNINTGTGGFTVDTASGGTISLDSTGTACNFTINTNGAAQDLNLAVLGSTDSSIILTSQGTGADAIKLDTTGGLRVDATTGIVMATGSTAAFNLESGSAGIIINTTSGGAIGIGNSTGGDLLIGNAAVARTITFGNSTGATTMNITSGTGGFNVDVASGGTISLDATGSACNFTINTTGAAQDLNLAVLGSTDSSIILTSQGTGADAIKLDTTGGIAVDCTGNLAINTGSSSSISMVGGSAGVLINTASGSGGAIGIGNNTGGDLLIGNAAVARTITFGNSTGATTINVSTGSGGMTIDAGGSGAISLAGTSGGDINIGTSSVARTLTIGNSTGATTINVSSGSGGMTIDASGSGAISLAGTSGGNINIGTSATARTLTIGNSTGASLTFNRFGTGGYVKSQQAHVALSDADATLTIANLITGILSGTPSTTRTLTLPTAANAVAGISGVEVGDSIDFYILNKNTGTNNPFSVAMGSGGTLEGTATVYPDTNPTNSYRSGGGSMFRLRFTNVSSGTETYDVYRLV